MSTQVSKLTEHSGINTVVSAESDLSQYKLLGRVSAIAEEIPAKNIR
jgi:hypothetical protein